MNSVVIGVSSWLAVQPVAGLAMYPLLRAASGRDLTASDPEPQGDELAPVVDLARWRTTHERRVPARAAGGR